MRHSALLILMSAASLLAQEALPAQSTVATRRDSATIVGTVTDRATAQPLSGVLVVVETTGRSATTNVAGRYRITGIATGAQTVIARRIGYAPLTDSITVNAVTERTVDLRLTQSAQQLDAVVTTGTVTPTAVRALPMPVTVISAEDIQASNPSRIDQLFRQFVPSGVAWDFGTNLEQTSLSARGAGSLSILTSTIKVFLDGIEITDRTNAPVDPKSIDRIEIIRGPQAAAIYGSDAIGGVMQIFTKRGDTSLARSHLESEAAAGIVQSPYAGYSGARRQEYSALLKGGAPTMTYSFGGSYTHTGDWMRDSKSSSPSAFGGVSLSQDRLRGDISARYYAQETPESFNSQLGEVWSFFATPFYRDYFNQEQTFGGRLTFDATSSWQHRLTVGVDRYSIDARQTRPRLTTPADTLLFVLAYDHSKSSVAYNTTALMDVAPRVHAAVTAGADYYVRRANDFLAFGAVQTTGTLTNAPGQPPQVIRNVTTNAGYFSQLQVEFDHSLFITGGVRVEDNSSFGVDVHRPVSPRAGAAYVHAFRLGTIKVRGSYGQAIRPPDAGQRDPVVFATNRQLANPLLGPERQSGWDSGADLFLGEQLSVSGTYYDQEARDLIASVPLADGTRDFRFQNIGRVRNTGLELEGHFSRGWLRLNAQYALTRARVQEVGSNYTGDLRVGDQVFLIPKHTGGISVSAQPRQRTQVTAGLTYLGSWKYYDFFAQYGCFGKTAPCRATQRDYLIDYPSLAKVSLSITQTINDGMSGFVAIDNLTNNQRFESLATNPVLGRITMFGVRLFD